MKLLIRFFNLIPTGFLVAVNGRREWSICVGSWRAATIIVVACRDHHCLVLPNVHDFSPLIKPDVSRIAGFRRFVEDMVSDFFAYSVA